MIIMKIFMNLINNNKIKSIIISMNLIYNKNKNKNELGDLGLGPIAKLKLIL